MNIDVELLNDICKYPNELKNVKKLCCNLIDMVKWSDENIINDFERKRFLSEVLNGYLKIIDNSEV
jgi:hypothetical protein